jgi:predicted aspartyl protease
MIPGQGRADFESSGTPTRRLTAAALLAAALAPRRAFAAEPPPSPPPAAPSSDATLKTRPDLSERMTTPVFVNGKGPYEFLVDTGANRSGITRELAVQLGLPPASPVRVHGIAAAYMADTVQIADFRFGALRDQMKAAPLFARADLGADGLLGIDLLRDREVLIDFIGQKLVISRPNWTSRWRSIAGPASDGVVVQARQRFGQLTLVDATAGKARMTCFIDTGAQQSVGNFALRAAVQARQRPDDIREADVTIHGATGQDVKGKVALVPSMHIGDIGFSRFALAFADLHTFDLWQLNDQPALLVGMDLLRLFDEVSIDFAGRQVRFAGAGGRRGGKGGR